MLLETDSRRLAAAGIHTFNSIHTRAWFAPAMLLLADLAAILFAATNAIALRQLAGGELDFALYAQLWPALGFFPLAFLAFGLYPGIGFSPITELRRVVYACSLVFLAIAAASFLLKGDGDVYSRGALVVAWLIALVLIPLTRALARQLFARTPQWGRPVVIFGAGAAAQAAVSALTSRPGLGLKPIGVFDDGAEASAVKGVPIRPGTAEGVRLAKEHGIPFAIVAMPGLSRERLLALLNECETAFAHLVLIPEFFGLSSLWVTAKDLGGVLGLEIRQQLLLPRARLTKRVLDLALCVVGGLVLLPFLALIALLIKMDSKGPVFYKHSRIGQGNRPFGAWKFRSMVTDADVALEAHLRANPQLRAEWARDQKLRNDPRITRVGRVIRRLSLDELPQLLNVLRGEMSLVGPRPIVEDEMSRYGGKIAMYARVKPGLTGLWQVSGRNDTTYDERVDLDAYYVRNWSVWLDLYILARTVLVFLSGRGAY